MERTRCKANDNYQSNGKHTEKTDERVDRVNEPDNDQGSTRYVTIAEEVVMNYTDIHPI